MIEAYCIINNITYQAVSAKKRAKYLNASNVAYSKLKKASINQIKENNTDLYNSIITWFKKRDDVCDTFNQYCMINNVHPKDLIY